MRTCFLNFRRPCRQKRCVYIMVELNHSKLHLWREHAGESGLIPCTKKTPSYKRCREKMKLVAFRTCFYGDGSESKLSHLFNSLLNCMLSNASIGYLVSASIWLNLYFSGLWEFWVTKFHQRNRRTLGLRSGLRFLVWRMDVVCRAIYPS